MLATKRRGAKDRTWQGAPPTELLAQGEGYEVYILGNPLRGPQGQ